MVYSPLTIYVTIHHSGVFTITYICIIESVILTQTPKFNRSQRRINIKTKTLTFRLKWAKYTPK